MERITILELVRLELNTFNRKQNTWGFRDWIDDRIDLIVKKTDALGDIYNMNGSYHGTIQKLIYRTRDETEEIALTFQEFEGMGKPRRIQGTTRYEPIPEDLHL